VAGLRSFPTSVISHSCLAVPLRQGSVGEPSLRFVKDGHSVGVSPSLQRQDCLPHQKLYDVPQPEGPEVEIQTGGWECGKRLAFCCAVLLLFC
jgi:hypothetical protein